MSAFRAALVLFAGTLLFGAALATRTSYNPFITTALAALCTALLSCALLGRELKPLLALRVRGALAALTLGILAVGLTHLAFRGAVEISPALENTVVDLYVDIRADMPAKAAAVPLVCGIAFAEELLWRGVAVDFFRSHLSPRKSALAATLSYALPQVASHPLLLLIALALGALLSTQRLVTGRVSDTFITHGIWSSAIFVLFPLV